MRILKRRTRDMPVLAVLAVEVAADTPQRVRERAGQVMEEGLLLNGIHRLRTDLPIGSGIQRAVLVQPYAADTVAAFMNRAAVVAECAFHRIILKFLVQACFVHENSPTEYSCQRLWFFFSRGRFVFIIRLKDK